MSNGIDDLDGRMKVRVEAETVDNLKRQEAQGAQNRATAVMVRGKIAQCEAILAVAYLDSHDNMRGRIAPIQDRIRATLDELDRIYGKE